MKKQPELTALTRKKLIDAYFIITAQGEKATVGAITQMAGYNRCTFYRYFADVEQLLCEVETEICDAFTDAVTEMPFTKLPMEVINSLVSVYQKYGDYLSVLLGGHGDPRFVGRMKAIIHPVAVSLVAKSSELEEISELKVEFALSAVLATVIKWYELGQPVSAVRLGQLLKELLQQGVLPSIMT